MFLEKFFGGGDRRNAETKKLPVVEAPLWEPVLINDTGVSVKWVKNDETVIQMECLGLWESPTSYMLTWGTGKKKFFIGKEEITSIEVL